MKCTPLVGNKGGAFFILKLTRKLKIAGRLDKEREQR